MSSIRRSFAIGLALVSVAAIVASLVSVGTPSQARLQRYDQQRVADLQGIASAATYYAARQYRLAAQSELPTGGAVLPEKLADIASLPGVGEVFIDDPITHQPYEYRRTGDLAYELCATFQAVSPKSTYGPNEMPAYPGSGWDHPIGRTCFSRTIDPATLQPDGVIPTKPFAQPPDPLQ